MSKSVSLSWTKEISKTGAYIRSASVFRDTISNDKDSNYKPEVNRYAFYHSYACPWSTRVLMVIKLKGLEHVISPISVVHTFLGEGGWKFPTEEDPCEGATPDLIHGKRFLREIYALNTEDGQWTGKVTVPVIFDKKTNTIVNNESAEIIRIFNSQFNDLAKYPEIDIYPEHLRKDIDELNGWIYDSINNGVYKCGFAQTQGAYEESYNKLFDALDKVEAILGERRYLCGSQFTEADIRLFTTLVRFDAVYVGHFKCNKKRLRDYHNLWNYQLEIAQMPWVKSTIRMDHIKNHYYQSHRTINPFGIVPLGPEVNLNEKHDRDKLKSDSDWVNHE